MSKTITFSYKGKDYTLEFDRKQVERMERSGFSIQNFDNATITSTYQLFNGAFQKHHRNIKSELTEEMFRKLTKRDELIKQLAEMYVEPIAALYDEPDEGDETIDWDANR